MPHAEIRYSGDLAIDLPSLFASLESTINQHDPSAGVCKCRAYPSQDFFHTHILVTVSMLTKPHRDAAFTQKLSNALEARIKAHLQQDCYFSFLLEYNPSHYVTNEHRVE